MTAAAETTPLETLFHATVFTDTDADATVAALTVERDKLREILRLRQEVAALRLVTDALRCPQVKLEVIKEVAAEAFGVTVREINHQDRREFVARARQTVFYVARQIMRNQEKMSMRFIGEATGGRDHGTVLHGVGRIDDLCASDATFRAKVSAVIHTSRKRLGLLEEGQEKLPL
jgi:chromosomal replication initiation ATPase DnaA